MEPAPSVAVVVLDWNGGEETLACLEAVRASVGTSPRIVLVDNASIRPVLAEVADRFPEIEVVRNDRNLGYAGGNNVGLRLALEGGASFVLVLNNDAEVRPDALREFVAAASQDENIGAVGARILRHDEPARLWMAWGEVTYRQSLVRLVGQGAPDGPPYEDQRDVPWVSGCAVLFTRAGLERVGLFDEDYFAYHEEVDWCARARESGLRVVFAPQAVVTHRGEGSSGGGRYVSRKQYLAARNMVRFVRRHGSVAEKLKFWSLLVATLPLQFLRRCLTGEQRGVLLKMRGVKDALLDRPIPRGDLGLD
ncbi:MAG: glycosyltransferase family 2 protein [Candidatus Binatia bacterium]|nr:glycosyltransferase family 2 protein [Candidatus Binatia bacterium]